MVFGLPEKKTPVYLSKVDGCLLKNKNEHLFAIKKRCDIMCICNEQCQEEKMSDAVLAQCI